VRSKGTLKRGLKPRRKRLASGFSGGVPWLDLSKLLGIEVFAIIVASCLPGAADPFQTIWRNVYIGLAVAIGLGYVAGCLRLSGTAEPDAPDTPDEGPPAEPPREPAVPVMDQIQVVDSNQLAGEALTRVIDQIAATHADHRELSRTILAAVARERHEVWHFAKPIWNGSGMNSYQKQHLVRLLGQQLVRGIDDSAILTLRQQGEKLESAQLTLTGISQRIKSNVFFKYQEPREGDHG
jgi:hypothetical protein